MEYHSCKRMPIINLSITIIVLLFRFLARDKALSETQKRLLAAEAQVNDLQARLSDALNQRRHFEDEHGVRRSYYYYRI